MDNTTGLLTVTESQFNDMQSLFFNIGGVRNTDNPVLLLRDIDVKYFQVSFELTANAQIWPRALNSVLGGEEGKIYLVAADVGFESLPSSDA